MSRVSNGGGGGLERQVQTTFLAYCTIVITGVKSFFSISKLPETVNYTDITLIPEVANPTCPNEFRPIRLCNLSYKIIYKVLDNGLKPYLLKIITPYQSAFVAGRMIQDTIVIAHEVLHHLHNWKKGKRVECPLKLDMHKAYNQVEWIFLLEVLARKVFIPTWIIWNKEYRWTKECISTVSYTVLVNGKRTKLIRTKRGMRQGDPISLKAI